LAILLALAASATARDNMNKRGLRANASDCEALAAAGFSTFFLRSPRRA